MGFLRMGLINVDFSVVGTCPVGRELFMTHEIRGL